MESNPTWSRWPVHLVCVCSAGTPVGRDDASRSSGAKDLGILDLEVLLEALLVSLKESTLAVVNAALEAVMILGLHDRRALKDEVAVSRVWRSTSCGRRPGRAKRAR